MDKNPVKIYINFLVPYLPLSPPPPPPLSVLHRVFTHHQVLPARSEFDLRRMVPIIPSLMTPVLAVLHFHSFQFAQQVPHFLITHHKDYCTRVDNPRALIPIDA